MRAARNVLVPVAAIAVAAIALASAGCSSGSKQNAAAKAGATKAGAVTTAPAGAGASSADAAHTLNGSYTIAGVGGGPTDSCAHVTGDIKSGTPVVVKGPGGGALGTATLDTGASTQGQCVFHFSLGVPDAASYTVQVGSDPPGTIAKDRLAARGWKVEFTRYLPNATSTTR